VALAFGWSGIEKGSFDGRILKIISLLSNYRCYL